MILPVVLFFIAAARAEPPAPIAGSVVRSKEWIVRRGAAPEEEFIGDVRYDSAGVKLSADWALYRRALKNWEARGRVILRRELSNGDVIEARGGKARYDETSLLGTLEPAPGSRVGFIRAPVGEEADYGEGDRLVWNGDRDATLAGRAHAWGPRLEAWADSARYEKDARRLFLRGGRPVARKITEDGGWTTALAADEIDVADSPRRLEARGKVKGWLVFKNEKKLKEMAQ